MPARLRQRPGEPARISGLRIKNSHYQGLYHGLQVTAQASDTGFLQPAYGLQLGDEVVDLNALCGLGFTLSLKATERCVACDCEVTRRYGGGYCYDCFTSLARCDLCYVSPDRCHHHLGTCREPDWGVAHCMQPHSVYLAVTSGPKVGITRQGREHRRWIDQGATAGLKIIEASTRRLAGLVEADLRGILNDRTDWKKMLAGRVQSYDLVLLAEQLRSRTQDFDHIVQSLEDGERTGATETISWQIDSSVTYIDYPIIERSPGLRLSIPAEGALRDNLLGVQGGYLLFSTGVLPLNEYRGVELSLRVSEALDNVGDTDQMSLF